MKHIIGIDNGNGTTGAYTNFYSDIFTSFSSSVITYGNEINKLSTNLDSGLERKEVSGDLAELNGNSPYLIVPYLGTNYGVGLTGAYMAGAHHINPVGEMRYTNEVYMRVMLMAAITGLVNGGLPVDKCNELYLGLGMAPGLYYSDKRDKIIGQVEGMYLGNTFYFDGSTFTVEDIVFTAEGLGAYYSHVFEDDMELNEVKSAGNTVIADAGHGTFDTFIISDFDLYGGVESIDTLGTTTLFKQVAEEINRTKGTSLNASDIELFYYTGYTPKRFTPSDFSRAMKKAKINYLARVQGHLTETYHGQSDYYSQMIVTGGIAKIYENDTAHLKAQIGLVDSDDIQVLPVNANAEGFFKAAYVTFDGEGAC